MPAKFQASRFNNKNKIAKSVDPLKYSVASYRLFFETRGRKYGRNLSWSSMMFPARQPMII